MVLVDDETIAARAQVFLSIVPPSEAASVALRFARSIRSTRTLPVFVDCTAVSVPRVREMEAVVAAAGAAFVDGTLVGLPPREDELGPAFYVSAGACRDLLGLGEYGRDMRCVDGPVGAASGLKLAYASITTGVAAVGAAMILAAARAGADDALRAKLAASPPQMLARHEKTLLDMFEKAYRWIDEMRSIADFIGGDLPEAGNFEAAALYERIARDRAGGGERDTGECAAIDAFLTGRLPER